jgi:hypothetical protein
MKLYFRVHKVDMNGYLGRDRHPEASDVGTVVVLVFASSYNVEDGDLIDDEEGTSYGEEWETILTCMRPDGTLVELMPHEVVIHTE